MRITNRHSVSSADQDTKTARRQPQQPDPGACRADPLDSWSFEEQRASYVPLLGDDEGGP